MSLKIQNLLDVVKEPGVNLGELVNLFQFYSCLHGRGEIKEPF